MDDRTVVGTNTVSDETALRGLYQQPMELAILKQLDRLDAHCRNFLAHSPFAVIGSTRPGRGTDVSPRGDAKALKRSRLWQDDYRVDKRSFPSLGRMIVEQTKPATVTVEQADAFIADNYVTGLY